MPTPQTAADESLPSSARRRITLRRGNYGGDSLTNSTQARGMRAHEDHEDQDEVDAAIDPEAAARRLNGTVRDASTDTFLPRDEEGTPNLPAQPNPRARLDEVALAGSAAYAKEYRLTLLHRLLMRRVPIDQIARQLNVSISTIEKDRVALKARLRDIAKEQDINEIVGRNLEIYDEIRGMSLRIASADSSRNGANGENIAATPTAMKLAAMRTALAATNDSNRMLSAVGVFDALRFRAAESATGQTDMQRLMSGADDIISRFMGSEGDDDYVPEAKKVKRVKRGGFKPLDYADGDSDTAAQESVEL